MKNLHLCTLLISLLIVSCGPSEREQAQQEQRQLQMQRQLAETTPEFDARVAAVLDRYFELKDALVESDPDQAKTTAGALIEEIAGVSTEEINEETAALWATYQEVIVKSGNELILLDEVDDQRYHFESISVAMIDLVDTFRPVGYEIYHQSCPMVRGGSADWLSRDEQIANPYHGDRMMRCGEVIRRI